MESFKYDVLPYLPLGEERKKLVVLTGAGISAESGVNTYRDKGGLWQQYDWRRLASVEGWEEEKEKMLDFYTMRRKELIEILPNHAHKMLAELEKWYDVSIITQNVDNLHERAGSTDVLHLHGELTKVTSSVNKDDPNCIQELPLDIPLRIGDKAADGSQLRPYIVWFGESVPFFERAIPIIEAADVFAVIGTSLQVYPAAGLVRFTRPNIQKFIIDPGEFDDPYAMCGIEKITHIKSKATTGLETLIDILHP